MSNTLQRIAASIFAIVMTAFIGWVMVGWPALYVPPVPESAAVMAAAHSDTRAQRAEAPASQPGELAQALSQAAVAVLAPPALASAQWAP